MVEIFSYGVAAWIGYETLRAVIPLPEWLLPFVVLGLCYAVTFAPPILLTVLNAAAVVAMLRSLAALVAVPRRWVPSPKERQRKTPTGRVPKLP